MNWRVQCGITILHTDAFLATSGDYKLLQQMNVVTKDKYVEMTGVVIGLTKNMEGIQQKCTFSQRWWLSVFMSSVRCCSVSTAWLASMLPVFCIILTFSDQDFQPYLKQIDEIETGVTELEQTVLLLDEYTKRLGEYSSFRLLILIPVQRPSLCTFDSSNFSSRASKRNKFMFYRSSVAKQMRGWFNSEAFYYLEFQKEVRT